jgi:hypothetical protein
MLVGGLLAGPAAPAAPAALTARAPAARVAPAAGVVRAAPADDETGHERGAYEWDDTNWWPNPSAYSDTLAALSNLGVTTLYVDITEAVTLTRAHSAELGTFEADFAQLVEEADADGMRVDAVGGATSWATTDKAGPAQLLSAVSQITADYPSATLDGVQFDVEPWALKRWTSRRAAYARDWLAFLRSTVTAWQRIGLQGRLGFTVPYWFDGDTGGVPEVTFDGSTGYPFQLALGLLSPVGDTVLNVMAYRNTTTGANGSIALFAGNRNAAVAAGSDTELLLGQETGEATPAEITFYGTSCAQFDEATGQIADAFDGDASYQGIAVDDVESLVALCGAPTG